MIMTININLLATIEVNDKDIKRCSEKCLYIAKRNGNYKCSLFDYYDVDPTGDDDEKGYAFFRCDKCLILATTTENKLDNE